MIGYSRGSAVWFVGLPGSGKSTLARGVHEYLYTQGYDVVELSMDKRRKTYFPAPEYTAHEREQAYAMFVDEAAEYVRQNKVVLMDGSANRVDMRMYARQCIPRFAEIFVQCDIEEAMRREVGRPGGEIMADMYDKALRRQRTGEQFTDLGEVIGVDVDFEIDPNAELIINNTFLSKKETLRKALHFLDTWLGSD